jgi:hypothetical protein
MSKGPGEDVLLYLISGFSRYIYPSSFCHYETNIPIIIPRGAKKMPSIRSTPTPTLSGSVMWIRETLFMIHTVTKAPTKASQTINNPNDVHDPSNDQGYDKSDESAANDKQTKLNSVHYVSLLFPR